MFVLAFLGCPSNTTTDDDTTPVDTDTDTLTTESGNESDTGFESGDTGSPYDTDIPCTPSTTFPPDDVTADAVLQGAAADDAAGQVLALLDFDGDDIDDLVVGAPGYDNPGAGAGRVWLQYGPISTSVPLDETGADGWIDPDDVPGEQIGAVIGDLGDMDGDGVADLGLRSGGVHLTYGNAARRSGGVFASSFEISIESTGAIGQGLTGVGDLNGDGLDDIAFADPDAGTDGTVYVLAGTATRLPSGDLDEATLPSLTGAPGDALCQGQCLVGGDFDGDGAVDLVITSETSGRVYVHYGDHSFPTGSVTDDVHLDAPPGAEFGSVAGVGDLDGDGYPELAVADPGADTELGKVTVVHGNAVRWTTGQLADNAWLTVVGSQPSGNVGLAVMGLGDVDCVGGDDLAVSAESVAGQVTDAGVVGVWLGPTQGTAQIGDATALILGTVVGQRFGAALAHGWVDSGTERDLVVGAPASSAVDQAGRVYLLLESF